MVSLFVGQLPNETLFFDRVRILYLLENKTKSIKSIMNFASFDSIVKGAILYEEKIV
jgi:hypothetical protein